MPNERLPIIRASELGEYVFCARAWWLRRVLGWEPLDSSDVFDPQTLG